jgi:hypothetical protein
MRAEVGLDQAYGSRRGGCDGSRNEVLQAKHHQAQIERYRRHEHGSSQA